MIKEIIKRTPDFIQGQAKYIYYSIPDNIRYGRVFNDKYKFLKKSQWWSKEKIEEYQMAEISKLLNHAYENVPYYKRVFDERGLKPKDIQNFHDLKQLPYLTKEILQNNIDDMIARNYSKQDLVRMTTSGTVGIPLVFYVDKQMTEREWAFITNQWSRIGYDIKRNNRCIILRGNMPKNGLCQRIGNDLILSSFQLTNDNIKTYLTMIEKFNPDFIQAYPTSAIILADFILQNKIHLNVHNLKAVICASENLFDFQRVRIEDAFKVRVYSFYGHSERCCFAGECERESYYHIVPEYGYTELVDENGKDLTEEDQVGEIIATVFNNYAVPFIRYKTMDITVNTNEKCSCGREHKLIKRILGREQEQIIAKDNTKITSMLFQMHYNAFKKIALMQLEQSEIGKVTFKVVQKERLLKSDIDEIINAVNKASNNKIDVDVKFVDDIERTKSGKQKLFIQNINLESMK